MVIIIPNNTYYRMHDYISPQYLRIIDELDLELHQKRRIAVYCLEEFYGTVMADVGRELLNLSTELKARNLRTQWDRVQSRLESLDGYENRQEYDSIINQLKSFRDKVAHDYDWKPPKSNIEHLREAAPEWREWLIEVGEKYNEVQRELDARETLLQLTEQSLSNVLESSVPSREPFKQDVQSAKQDAKPLQNDFDCIKTKTSEITPELVRLFSDAKELRQTVRQAQHGAAAVDRHIQTEVDEAIEEAAFQRMKRREE